MDRMNMVTVFLSTTNRLQELAGNTLLCRLCRMRRNVHLCLPIGFIADAIRLRVVDIQIGLHLIERDRELCVRTQNVDEPERTGTRTEQRL